MRVMESNSSHSATVFAVFLESEIVYIFANPSHHPRLESFSASELGLFALDEFANNPAMQRLQRGSH